MAIKLDVRAHRAIKTEYKGPTDTRGGRVIATVVGSGKRFTFPWDHAQGVFENHAAAAMIACERMEWTDGTLHGASVNGGGYVFTLTIEDPIPFPMCRPLSVIAGRTVVDEMGAHLFSITRCVDKNGGSNLPPHDADRLTHIIVDALNRI